MGFPHILTSHSLLHLCSLPLYSPTEIAFASITNDLHHVLKPNTHVLVFILLSLSMALDKNGLKHWAVGP